MIFDIPTPWDHGAIGDGSANDTMAVQSALNAASTSPFKRCSLAGGTFMVSNVSTPSDVTLEGKGRLVQLGGVFAPVVTMSNPRAGVRDFEVDGNASAQTTNNMGIEYGSEDLLLSGMHIHNVVRDGVTAVDGALRVLVEKARIHNTGRVGATIGGLNAAHIMHRDCFVHDTGEAGMGIMGVAHHASFEGNHTKNTGGDGIAAYNAANRFVSAIGNNIQVPNNHGIHISGDNSIVVGNDIEGVTNGHGVFFRNHGESIMYGGVMASNIVRGVTPGSAYRVDLTERFTVSGNYGETGPTEQWGIYLNRSRYGSVSGNTLVGPGESVMGGEFGILLGGSSRNVIGANNISGYQWGVGGSVVGGVQSHDNTVDLNHYDTTMGEVYQTGDCLRWKVAA